MGADLIVVPDGSLSDGENILLNEKPAMFFFGDSGFEKITGISGVAQASPGIFISTLAGQACCSGHVQVIAIDPARDFTVAAWLKEHPGVTMEKDDILIGSMIDGDTGTDLKFYGHTFRIVGKLDPSGMRGVDNVIFTRIDDIYAAAGESGTKAAQPPNIPEGKVSSVLVRVDPGASAGAIGSEIRSQVPGTKTITQNTLLGLVLLHLTGIVRFLNHSSIAVIAISIPLTGLVSAIVARELQREISMLGALGATKEFVTRLVFTGTFISSVIGSLIGIAATMVILLSFQNFIAFILEIPFAVPSPFSLLAIVSGSLLPSLAIGAIASIYPTIHLIRSAPPSGYSGSTGSWWRERISAGSWQAGYAPKETFPPRGESGSCFTNSLRGEPDVSHGQNYRFNPLLCRGFFRSGFGIRDTAS